VSKSTWTGAVNSDWANAGNWSPDGIPGAGSDVVINKGAPIASASIGTVNSITDSSSLSFESAGTNTVATTLDNTGHLYVDDSGGEGGTTLNIGGTLTNSGSLTIGNTTLSAPDTVAAASIDNTASGSIHLTGSSANQALLDVAGNAGFGAAGVLSGYVRVAGDGAIEFEGGGQITSLAADAQLHLNGDAAFIEDSAVLGSNSALMGLASIGLGAYFELENNAAVSTTGSLANDGHVRLDLLAGGGGSSLKVGGTLNNTGFLIFGNSSLSSSDSVTASSLINSNSGVIELTGAASTQALLDVTAGGAGFGTAGTVTGIVRLTEDSAIEFLNGQITTIGASSKLTLDGSSAFIEDSTALGSNSALAGLTNVAGSLYLDDGASLSTTGALTNNGLLGMDLQFDSGGSALSVDGGLTNNGTLYIGIGAGGLSAPDTLTADSLSNANTGTISLYGYETHQALIDVTTGDAGFGTLGTVTGTVALTQDSAIEFASGQITTIGAGGDLVLTGDNAFVEDRTALGSNSALTGLANVAGSGSLYVEGGAEVSTDQGLTNSGLLGVDFFTGAGGSTLSIGGALTNTATGLLAMGNNATSSTDSVTVTSLVNSGSVELHGIEASLATLNVSGTTTNNGVISITADTETLAGAVRGSGSINLSNSNLLFDSSVSAGQKIGERGKDELTLEQAQNFAATISGFGKGDTIDATNFLAPPATTYNFVENSGATGGTLTLTDGSLIANILMKGVYSNSSFSLAPDSGTGTLVKFV
jgi:hypothetical protein